MILVLYKNGMQHVDVYTIWYWQYRSVYVYLIQNILLFIKRKPILLIACLFLSSSNQVKTSKEAYMKYMSRELICELIGILLNEL